MNVESLTDAIQIGTGDMTTLLRRMADAAERQAAALERIAAVQDPFNVAQQIQDKDAEIARLKAAAEQDAVWIVRAQNVMEETNGYCGLPAELRNTATDLLNTRWGDS